MEKCLNKEKAKISKRRGSDAFQDSKQVIHKRRKLTEAALDQQEDLMEDQDSEAVRRWCRRLEETETEIENNEAKCDRAKTSSMRQAMDLLGESIASPTPPLSPGESATVKLGKDMATREVDCYVAAEADCLNVPQGMSFPLLAH